MHGNSVNSVGVFPECHFSCLLCRWIGEMCSVTLERPKEQHYIYNSKHEEYASHFGRTEVAQDTSKLVDDDDYVDVRHLRFDCDRMENFLCLRWQE